MDPITSLSIYRESLISSLWTLDSFPDELREFAAKERRYLEGAKTIDDVKELPIMLVLLTADTDFVIMGKEPVIPELK